MNKSCVFYEQESGELDEDELYQVHFNPHVFMEEFPAPSAMLEVVIMLDLSGSMTDENKLELQLVYRLLWLLRLRQIRIFVFQYTATG